MQIKLNVCSCSVVSDSLWPYGLYQAPLFLGFSKQEYWSGLSCNLLGDLSHPRLEPMSLWSPTLADKFFFFLLFFYLTILYWFCHTSTCIRHGCTCVPHPETPPTSLPVPSLWVIPVHQPQASCILHRTWTGDSFHIWYYTYFNAISALSVPLLWTLRLFF